MIDRWTKAGEAKSVALIGNAADIFPELVRRGVRPISSPTRPARTTPCTAICRRAGAWPNGARGRRATPKRWRTAARASMKVHVQAMVDFWNAGVPTLDYGNNIRQVALEEGLENAFAFPGFVPAYIRPLFCRGVGPFRWCALSGDPEDIYRTDAKMKELFPDMPTCIAGSTWRGSGFRFRGCRRGSAGSGWASGTARGWPSTRWCAMASSRRRW